MKREILITKDGSTTIHLPDWNEQYHSKHGAIQEAYHVFIKQGLKFLGKLNEIAILEMGFGTGLNCFITFLESCKNSVSIEYTGIEAYPVLHEELTQLNYVTALSAIEHAAIFKAMHDMPWETPKQLHENFILNKRKQLFDQIAYLERFDLIYFDAFGPRVQPELWTEAIFLKMFKALKPGGCLVTYSAKGSVRRAMIASGFNVERLEGPPGKREMLRAVKDLV